MSYSFGIQNTVDFYRALERHVDDYLKSPLSSEKAVVSAMFSWHLTDWIYNEYPSIASSFNKLGDYVRDLKSQCPSLAFMQDISNGTKHHSITKYVPSVRKTEEHHGAFSDAFQKTAFDVSCLKLTLADGSVVYFDEVITKVRDFWRNYFKNTLGASV